MFRCCRIVTPRWAVRNAYVDSFRGVCRVGMSARATSSRSDGRAAGVVVVATATSAAAGRCGGVRPRGRRAARPGPRRRSRPSRSGGTSGRARPGRPRLRRCTTSPTAAGAGRAGRPSAADEVADLAPAAGRRDGDAADVACRCRSLGPRPTPHGRGGGGPPSASSGTSARAASGSEQVPHRLEAEPVGLGGVDD